MADKRSRNVRGHRWTVFSFGEFILRASDLLAQERYDHRDINWLNQIIAPQILGSRESPLPVLADSIREVALGRPELARESLIWIAKLPPEKLPIANLHNVLNLLVELEFNIGEVLVNVILERFIESLGSEDFDEDFAESLVYFAGLSGGGLSSISVVERLRARRVTSEFLSEAALRMVATFEPSKLSTAIKILNQDFRVESVEEFRAVVDDLVERSSFYDILRALTSLEPTDFPVFFRAAFGDAPGKGAFTLCRASVSPSIAVPRKHIVIRDREIRYISDFFGGETQSSRERDWMRSVHSVIGYMSPALFCTPPVEDFGRVRVSPVRRHYREEYADQMGIQICSVSTGRQVN